MDSEPGDQTLQACGGVDVQRVCKRKRGGVSTT